MQIWTQGQGKYTSHWLPSFDDENEKVIFNTKITFESGYDVISNGTLDSKTNQGKQTTWSYKMTQPMRDRKSTRLNSSHVRISYAVFCLKKKKKKKNKVKKKKKKKTTQKQSGQQKKRIKDHTTLHSVAKRPKHI